MLRTLLEVEAPDGADVEKKKAARSFSAEPGKYKQPTLTGSTAKSKQMTTNYMTTVLKSP